MAILVVEDEALIRTVAAETFKDLGFIVLEAASGDEALAVMKSRNDVSALFTDIEMPGRINGLTLAHPARSANPEIKIIISSGRLLPKRQDLPEHTWFLAKPYTADDLAAIAEDIQQGNRRP